MATNRSQVLWERALDVIPGGVNSPVRAMKSVGLIPPFIRRPRVAISRMPTATATSITSDHGAP